MGNHTWVLAKIVRDGMGLVLLSRVPLVCTPHDLTSGIAMSVNSSEDTSHSCHLLAFHFFSSCAAVQRSSSDVQHVTQQFHTISNSATEKIATKQ